MNLKLAELEKKYLAKKEINNGYEIFDDVKILDFEDIEKDEYTINCKYMIAEDKYMIYISFESVEDNSTFKILFNGLLEQSLNDLSFQYDIVKRDMMELSFDNFIDKYYEKLEKNI